MPDTVVSDDLNRSTVDVLMAAKGIDTYADLARRMERASRDLGNERTFERSYVSRVMRGERPAQPSFIICCAAALATTTVAITGQGVEIDASEGAA